MQLERCLEAPVKHGDARSGQRTLTVGIPVNTYSDQVNTLLVHATCTYVPDALRLIPRLERCVCVLLQVLIKIAPAAGVSAACNAPS